MEKWLAAILLVIILAGCSKPVSTPQPKAPDLAAEVEALRKENASLKQQLVKLEPEQPKWVVPKGYGERTLQLLSEENVAKTIQAGKVLRFALVEQDGTWTPPQYSPAWHSTSAKPFPISALVATARRRFHVLDVFTGSIPSSIEALLGLESRPGWERPKYRPCGQIPEYPCHDLNEVHGSWKIYALQAQVMDIRQQGNLIVFVVRPELRGYEILWLDGSELRKAVGQGTEVVVAFATPDGAVLEAIEGLRVN